MKKIGISIAIALLVLFFAAYFADLANSPEQDWPIEKVEITDTKQYLQTNAWVSERLEHFSGLLPEKESLENNPSEYVYKYQCAHLGTPSFFVFVTVSYADPEMYNSEIQRISSINGMKKQTINNHSYYCDDTLLNTAAQLLDTEEIFDGLQHFFEFACPDDSNQQIQYCVAVIDDSHACPKKMLPFLLEIAGEDARNYTVSEDVSW